MQDFLIPERGRAAPYGVYNLAHHTGWVNVGVDEDTASFAVETIRALVVRDGPREGWAGYRVRSTSA